MNFSTDNQELRNLINEHEDRVEKRLKFLISHEFSGLSVGKADSSLVSNIRIETATGAFTLDNLASINANNNTLTIKVWETANTSRVKDALVNSGLQLNLAVESTVIKATLPLITEQRRKDLAKVAHKYAEEARKSLRLIREDSKHRLKLLKLSEDEEKRVLKHLQESMDNANKTVDNKLKDKEKEILNL